MLQYDAPEALRRELLDEAYAGAFSGLGAMLLDAEEIRNADARGYELVNPIQVWLINDRLLILQCHDDDGGSVYIDTRRRTIVNKSLDGSVPRKVLRQILDTPDYFEYIVTETQACQ